MLTLEITVGARIHCLHILFISFEKMSFEAAIEKSQKNVEFSFQNFQGFLLLFPEGGTGLGLPGHLALLALVEAWRSRGRWVAEGLFPSLLTDNRGSGRRAHCSPALGPEPSPETDVRKGSAPFPSSQPLTAPRQAARARGPRGVPAVGPFLGSQVQGCARPGDSPCPFPVKPRQGKKINATFQRKL